MTWCLSTVLAPLPSPSTRRDVLVFPAPLFRDALIRERRRADRFDERSLLVRVSLRRVPRGDRRVAAEAAIYSLLAVRRETDLVGWFTTGLVLGLLVPQCGEQSPSRSSPLIARVSQQLSRRLGPELAPLVEVRVRLLSASSATRVAGFQADRVPRTNGQRARVALRDATKRALDIAGGVLLLLICAPVLLIVAFAVRMTSAGPIIFRQTRIGERGEPFSMLKFRTMYVDADSRIHEQYVSQFIKTNGAASGSGAAAVYKLVNDPRITRIGHFLRKTSLDELPQFWNVLRGEMSLVGPRPPLPYEVKEYRPWHHRRVLDAKPGITGLWQVVGRSRTTFDDMVRLDLRYARTRSLWRDISILLATPRAVVSGKGAN